MPRRCHVTSADSRVDEKVHQKNKIHQILSRKGISSDYWKAVLKLVF